MQNTNLKGVRLAAAFLTVALAFFAAFAAPAPRAYAARFTLTFDANGGTGAPPAVTKKHNQAVTISRTQPTRPGAVFLGWSEKRESTVAEYRSGDSITISEDTTLYAVWRVTDYMLTYDANGGKKAPPTLLFDVNASEVIITDTIPTRGEYRFIGWAVGDRYADASVFPGDSIPSPCGDITLYAKWSSLQMDIITSDYVAPAVKNNTDLVKWANHAVEQEWGYVLGTYGNLMDRTLLEQKIMQYYNSDNVNPLTNDSTQEEIRNRIDELLLFSSGHILNYRTTDCVGLIKGYLWLDAANGNINYKSNGIRDYDANSILLYASAKQKINADGEISIPEIPGLGVWTNNHVGIYIGNGKVIEANSLFSPVKITSLKKEAGQNLWKQWFMIPGIEYAPTVTYDFAGGSNGPAVTGADYGTNRAVISDIIPVRHGYKFLGWTRGENPQHPRHSRLFKGGNIIVLKEDTTLYAVWQKK